MLFLARWLMRGTPQAVIGAFVATVIPWLFMLGAAVVSLVTLRRGLASAVPVLMAAVLPAGWWWIQGDAIPLTCLLLVTLMAVVLRARRRWSEALLAGVLGGGAMVQLGVFLPPAGVGPMLDQVRQISPEFAATFDELARQGMDTEQLASILFGGVVGLVVLLAATGVLALARGWQAGLYNPGGFREEFHALRLAPRELLVLLGLVIAAVVLGMPSLGALLWVPLLVAGIALVHGFIGLKGMSGLWLVVFYILLVFTWPMILIVLLAALLDSFVDFRARLGRGN